MAVEGHEVTCLELEEKLKTALDETRLLILGAQVLFGFAFQSVFQDLFKELPAGSRFIHCSGILLFVLAVSLLIAPSLHHQLLYGGETREGALENATFFAGASLLPLTLGLGTSALVVFSHLFGTDAGIAAGIVFSFISVGLLYGLGLVMRVQDRRSAAMPHQETETPLKAKIEQLLTEARVIIPGGQALLGFQLTATLTKAFSDLPDTAKNVHVGGLCAIALAVTLLMTPAALHRIAYGGENNNTFFRIGSVLVVTATFPLALGVSADVYVAFLKATESASAALTASVVSAVILLGLWFAYPMLAARGHGGGATRAARDQHG
jgi:hypothetical protein